MFNRALPIIVLIGAILWFNINQYSIFVRVEQGTLEGRKLKSRNGKEFYGFFKIPFAKPPLGDLRFRSPVEPDRYAGIRDATKDDGVICTQRNVYSTEHFFITGEEDCLYMNVFTPSLNQSYNELLPVMVFLHGGGWVCGSGNGRFYSPYYLMDKEIVFVSINYRLGPLGFLSMEDEKLPGNYGLKDQVQALKWINKNIRNFGGNPNLVTIFGESAGGASVHFHMLSPQSKGLFHRAISQSGTAFSSWALGQPGITKKNTLKLAKALMCPIISTESLVDCLRRKPAKDIIGTDLLFMEWFSEPMIPFKPVVEKFGVENEKFIVEHPESSIKKGKVNDVPWITGINSGEGALRVAAFFDDPNLLEELSFKFEEIAPMSFFYKDTVSDVAMATKAIKDFYFGKKPIGFHSLQELTNLWTDGWFLAGANDALHLMQRHLKSSIYYYYYTYRGAKSFGSIFGNGFYDFGAAHGDELLCLFPVQRLRPHLECSEMDEKYVNLLSDLWVNFAKTGKPSSLLMNETWIPFTKNNLAYLHVGAEDVKMKANLLPERSQFWNSFKSYEKKKLKDEL